jgi:hypothetical protein
MSDDTSLTSRLRSAVARLAPSQDGDVSPQARDEEPIAISREEHTQEPDRDDIERWRREYYKNPLIRQPIRKFAADVVEPGVRIAVDAGDDDEPTVPSDYRFAEFQGMDLSDALRLWLSRAAIVGGRFDRDITDLLEDVIIDLRGRRGTALVEHAYDDPEEREYILGLRPFKVETTTAYTRDGKNILLRPGDTDVDFETVAVQDISGDPTRFDTAPTTPADQAAAFVQYDDIFGSYEEKDDIPFALDDVTLISNDPDTGTIFGEPDTASVVDRSEELREMFEDTMQAVKAVGYGHWVAQVDTDDEDEARSLLDSFDPSDPERVNVTNYAVETQQFDGQVPSNVEHIQQQIEYILAALPTPLYRVGFAGDINRDISDVQQDDYREAVSRERDRLESAFHDLLKQKTREFLHNDAKADESVDVDVSLVIEPEESDSPLEDENFNADEFSQTMSALKAAAPGGAVEQLVPPHEVRETFLGLDPEPPDAPDTDADALALPDETDERVEEAFRDAYLATRYEAGDEVETPSGVGVVIDVLEEDGTFAGTAIEASTQSPTYIVATEGGRPAWEEFKASDIQQTTIEVEGVDDPTDAAAEAQAMADLAAATESDIGPDGAKLGVTDWDYPPSWKQSPTPNRVILLKAWAGMNGQFDCGGDCCKGEIVGSGLSPGAANEFCASMKDRVLLTEQWRGG